jgi:hypothetical protein
MFNQTHTVFGQLFTLLLEELMHLHQMLIGMYNRGQSSKGSVVRRCIAIGTDTSPLAVRLTIVIRRRRVYADVCAR